MSLPEQWHMQRQEGGRAQPGWSERRSPKPHRVPSLSFLIRRKAPEGQGFCLPCLQPYPQALGRGHGAQ